jgi:hypothetical protein
LIPVVKENRMIVINLKEKREEGVKYEFLQNAG